MGDINRTHKIGTGDQAIFAKEADEFSIDAYIQGLTNFILNCDTPITISLQGEWGTGKTSFMYLIEEALQPKLKLPKLEEDEAPLTLKPPKRNVVTVQFNTWRYSQFNQEESLGVSFLSYMIRLLEKELPKKKRSQELIKQSKNAIRTLSYASLNILLAQANLQGVTPSEEESLYSTDSADAIEVLRQTMQKLVEVYHKELNYDRIVIFIDDLDRLPPKIAVNLLEVIKLFVDL